MSLKFFLLLALCLLATVSAGGEVPAKCLLPQAPGMCRAYSPLSTSTRTRRSVRNSCTVDVKEMITDLRPKQNARKSVHRKLNKMSLKFFLLLSFYMLSTVMASTRPAKCSLPKVQGVCKAYIPSFYFNKETQKCEQFVYGGCQGNENRFGSMEKCEEECVRK